MAQLVTADFSNNAEPCVLRYTTVDNTMLKFKDDAFDAEIISHTYKNGEGVVIFSKSITKIGDWAFCDCKSIEYLIIPDSVYSIGHHAFFRSCFKNITIPNSIDLIGDTAFGESVGCELTINCDIPCKSILRGVFYNSKFYKVTIGKNVSFIGENSFDNCLISNLHIEDLSAWLKITFCKHKSNPLIGAEKLFINGEPTTKLTIPSGITKLTRFAFLGCNCLTSVILPNGITQIDDFAFANCKFLTSITIPTSVKWIGNSAFEGCLSLTDLTIPNSVTSIGICAFCGCRELTSINIPDSVTSIGGCAFARCEKISHISIPNSVTKIKYHTFENCSSLTNVSIPNSVISIEEWGFADCANLSRIHIPNGVIHIGIGAFAGCNALTKVHIPNSVTSIGEMAFVDCANIEMFDGKYASRDNRCLIVDGVLISFAPAGLTNYIIPADVISIARLAFNNCSMLEQLTIPEHVTSCAPRAFDKCKNLKKIICNAKVPPKLNLESYKSINKNMTIVIPEGSKDAYIKSEWINLCTKLKIKNFIRLIIHFFTK